MAQEVTISSLSTSDIARVNNVKVSGKTYVGIDFGTSTTVVSIASVNSNGKFYSKTLSLKVKHADGSYETSTTIPTMIASINGKPYFGAAAAKFKYELERGKNIWYSFKMELGENKGKQYYASDLGENSKFTIQSPKDAATLFFFFLKRRIEEAVKEEGFSTDIEYAVSIPASFEANQRKDLVEALEANGINISKQSLIDEPNAAFLSYVFDSAENGHPISIPDDYNPNVLVFDYGAGTCDISILEIGKDHKGVYSKNKAISKFERCGGDDIDRFIAEKYLFPQLLEENSLKESDFKSKEKEKAINGLMKSAELLKIEICNNVALKSSNGELPALCNSEECISHDTVSKIKNRLGTLTLTEPKLSYRQFNEMMKTFLCQTSDALTKPGEDDYNSVFMNINSALKKAELNKEDIDYVLFIGGSSYNPYLQFALRLYFAQSEILVPHNLQTHVSQGAAIHSFIFNCMGHNLINPITSESIIVILKNSVCKTLIPAGTYIPTETIIIDDLEIDSDGQKEVEIPICVGNKDKILANLKVECPNKSKGYSKGDTVRIDIRIDHDKLLVACAWINGERYDIEPVNPFANKELTTQERSILKAQRDVNNEAAENGGKPTKQSLKALAAEYEKAGQSFNEAETYEDINEYYPGTISANNIGVAYGNAGNKEKHDEYLKKAIEEDPNDATVIFNYAQIIKENDPEEYEKLMKRSISIDEGNPVHGFDYGRWLKRHGKVEEGQALVDKSIKIWKDRMERGQMESWDYSWFESAARLIGDIDLAHKIHKASLKTEEGYYNPDNLINIKNS